MGLKKLSLVPKVCNHYLKLLLPMRKFTPLYILYSELGRFPIYYCETKNDNVLVSFNYWKTVQISTTSVQIITKSSFKSSSYQFFKNTVIFKTFLSLLEQNTGICYYILDFQTIIFPLKWTN